MIRLPSLFALFAAIAAPVGADTRLDAVKTWMYQLQELYEPEAWAVLAQTDYDMLVVEPGQNFAEWPYDTPAMVQALRHKPDGTRRVVLAYVDIGQAEDYRDYWAEDWEAPEEDARGEPDFLVSIDPDGWSGNYPVAYWQAGWQALWEESGLRDRVVRLHRADPRTEVRSRIRWVGWRWAVRAVGRLVRLYVTYPAARQSLKDIFGMPLDVVQQMGYGLFAGRNLARGSP